MKAIYKIYIVRSFHAFFGIFFLVCIIYLYYEIFSGQRTVLAYYAAAALILEGLLLILNRGNCPLARLHQSVGDDKGFFNLFVPDKFLPYTMPFLTVISAIAIILIYFY